MMIITINITVVFCYYLLLLFCFGILIIVLTIYYRVLERGWVGRLGLWGGMVRV